MKSETPPLFGKTRFLQGLIDEAIDKISEGTIYMEMGVKAYLQAGKASAACEEKLKQVVDTKEHCAELRRRILTLLYTEMLIPDARGDVLRLLHSLLVWFLRFTKPHLLVQDRNTRIGLMLAGMFDSYSMGANGIGNMMGFFVMGFVLLFVVQNVFGQQVYQAAVSRG